MSFNEPLKVTLKKQEMKANRIKETKQLELNYSKEVCALYREYQNQLQRQKEYQDVVEIYRSKIQEIEELKQTREEIIRAKEQAEIDQERERVLYEEYLRKMEIKKKQFDKFMKQKGAEAFEYFRKLKQTKDQLNEEIYRYDRKRQTKNEFTDKAKNVVSKYKEEQKKIEEENKNDNNTMNILYKLTTPFHNNGNKIDYSTTRFHNVVVLKHNDDISEYINAFDRAKEESEKVQQRKKEKETKIENFNKNTEKNYKEIIRKNKAKENLAQLTAQLDKITKAKKKQHQSNKANINSNINNAKDNDKKSEFLVDKLLTQQKGNRTKILTQNPSDNTKPSDVSIANEDSMRNFYKDDSELVEHTEDDYFTKAMQEHNEEIDKALQSQKFYFEEPIARDAKPQKEKIQRMSPVDLPSYQKAEYEQEVNIIHKEPAVTMATQIRNSLRNTTTNNNSEIGGNSMMESTFSILDALNVSSKGAENEDKKGKQAVKEFYSKISQVKKRGSVASSNLWNIKEEVEGPNWEEEEEKKKSERSKKTTPRNIKENIKK